MRRQRKGEDRPLQPAKNYILWLLSRRDYSAKQLRDKLKLKGYDDTAIEDALALMQSYNYQSDERFAENKIRSAGHRLGDRGIRAKLAEDGIDQELTSVQLDQLAPEEERVLTVIGRFEGKLLDEQLRNKVWRHLASRGFSSNSIRKALQHLTDLAKDVEQSDDE